MKAIRLAELAGITRGAISLILSGETKTLKSESATAIARALGIQVSWLVDGQPPMRPEPRENGGGASGNVRAYHPDDPIEADTVFIKESRISFAAGNGHKAHIELVEESEPATYRKSWFDKERIKPDRCRRFRIVGHSQEPFLFPGDTILVNFDETEIKNDMVYALRYDDELRVKKIRKTLGGLQLISWNDREYPPENVPADQVDEHITIIGRVRDKSGRGGL